VSPAKIRNWFDRYAVWSINTYQASGLALHVIGLMLVLLFLPTVWSRELPIMVVIGAPMAIFAAVMLHGLKVEKHAKRRRRPKTSCR
jgi:uncharacterized membrane protein